MTNAFPRPLVAGDQVRLVGDAWGPRRGESVTVDSITDHGNPWSEDPELMSLARSVHQPYDDVYEVRLIDPAAEGDALIAEYETAQAAVRGHVFPRLIEDEVTDDGETYKALRCPRCGVLVNEGELFAVSPAEHWAPNEEPDDWAFDHQRVRFDASERPDLEPTLYYKHGDDFGHAVSLPEGWTEDWL